MIFKEVLAQVIDWLQQDKRLSYRALKRQFALDDDYLDDLKAELIEARRMAVDEDGRVLVWTGDTPPASATPSVPTVPSAPGPLTYTPPYLTEKILTSRSVLAGERKQVTVLFADLKGSMELLADRDPEEARQLLDPVLQRMMNAVHRYEGTVNQVMGDGIMALFGAPIAHEDHAVRACYAALAMQEAIHHYSAEVRRGYGLEVQIRVGLNSGEVVVRAIGNDLHMDYSAIGQTTHLAARMEQLAPPGSIRLTAATLRLAAGWVQVTPLGPVPVKGLSDPVEVYELLGAGPARTHLQAFAARGLTPFVGRQAELALLSQALEQAAAGHGQVVAVIGEPGVGKTRLFHEFTQVSRTQGWLLLESSSASYGKATPYLPVIDLLKAYFQLEDRDDERRMREKLTGRLLTLDPALGLALPAFLALLEVSVEDAHWQALEPAQRRQRTLDALKRLLLLESQVQPLLLIFENLHWIDAETQAFLDSLVESLPAARLLLLVNYRPEYAHGWRNKTYYAQLRLDPLPPASAEALLQALLGDAGGAQQAAPLQDLIQLLITRTEGNPFFLEESVRTLVETGILVGTPGAYRLVHSIESLQVPATVQAVLAARIDRLPPEEKQLLQIAAVIGTEVPLALLQTIVETPEEPLRLGLTHLQAAEFLYETHLFPDLAYTFKHALTQQVAYETLLQERRRAVHAQIVEALEALAGDRLAEQVDRLAHHAFRGELWDKALAYYRQAGTRAAVRSAYREVVTYFKQALAALAQIPECRNILAQAIDLQLALRQAFFALGEYGPMRDALQEADTLATALGDHRRLGQVATYMSQYFWATADQERALVSGQRALAVAETLGDVSLQAIANLYMGQAYYTLGNPHRSIECLRKSVALLQGDLLQERLGLPYLPSVFSRLCLAGSLGEVGAFAEGMATAAEGVRIAEAIDDPLSRIAAYNGVGWVSFLKGDLHQVISVFERGLALFQSLNIPVWPIIHSLLGAAYALSGRIAEALPLLEQAVEHANTRQLMANQALWLAHLSEAYLLAGRLDDAHTRAGQALEFARGHKGRGHEAYALRLLGEVTAQREPPDIDQATTHYRQALALAEELGMRPLQAHCHRGLGMWYVKTGQQEQARAELSAAIVMYRAMDMTFWLPQTEAALAQMEGQ